LHLEHGLVTSDDDFDTKFEQLTEELKTTAVFDGVGGEIITRIAPRLPRNATIWFYGFLAGATPVSVASLTFPFPRYWKDRQSLGTGFTAKAIRSIIRQAASDFGFGVLAPHDLRRT
jgi:NADPH:quinone reductase-like Zn-dependent oxidoreductase